MLVQIDGRTSARVNAHTAHPRHDDRAGLDEAGFEAWLWKRTLLTGLNDLNGSIPVSVDVLLKESSARRHRRDVIAINLKSQSLECESRLRPCTGREGVPG